MSAIDANEISEMSENTSPKLSITELSDKYAKKLVKTAETVDMSKVYEKLSNNGYKEPLEPPKDINQAIDQLTQHVAHMNAVLIALIKARDLEIEVNIVKNKAGMSSSTIEIESDSDSDSYSD